MSDNLNSLGIDQNQLIALAMIIGTDYNPGGIRGVGPKNALKLVKKHGSDFDALFTEVKWDENFDFPWTDSYELEWKSADFDGIKEMLVGQHDFSEERVNPTLEKLKKESTKKQQRSLGDF